MTSFELSATDYFIGNLMSCDVKSVSALSAEAFKSHSLVMGLLIGCFNASGFYMTVHFALFNRWMVKYVLIRKIRDIKYDIDGFG